MTLIPTIYNADTLGIRPDLVGRPITMWKDLLDPAFKGKASILNIPSIGIMDAAMVCESMDGQPAAIDIMSPEGKLMEKAGTVRDGGGFYEHMGHVACWNSVMGENRYMVQKWNEFVAA